MEHHSHKISNTPYRHGFHYYSDTSHFTENDLQIWLPKLMDLQAAWLILQSSQSNPIPSNFLEMLIRSHIQPIISINPSLHKSYEKGTFSSLFKSYAQSGVKHIILFDRPNLRGMWKKNCWSQPNLVERFLKQFIPLAESAADNGLAPVFPPLQPGGDYWDTAFLWIALKQLQEQKKESVLKNLTLSAYAWDWKHSLNWGAGGQERWPNASPYNTSTETQDQRGFRIFDWYQTIAKAVLNKPLPIILLEAGSSKENHSTPIPENKLPDAGNNYLEIVRLLSGESVQDPLDPEKSLEIIPREVISCNFVLLENKTNEQQKSDKIIESHTLNFLNLPSLKSWLIKQKVAETDNISSEIEVMKTVPTHNIKHYLLLPNTEWAANSKHMQALQPYIKRYQPVIGFSSEEAALDKIVTIITGEDGYPEAEIAKLLKQGCNVRKMQIKSPLSNKNINEE